MSKPDSRKLNQLPVTPTAEDVNLETLQHPTSNMLLTIKDLAKMLQVSEKTIYQWVALGNIPYLKIGKLLRFDSLKVLEYFEKSAIDKGASHACRLARRTLGSGLVSWSLKTRAGQVLRKE